MLSNEIWRLFSVRGSPSDTVRRFFNKTIKSIKRNDCYSVGAF